MTVDVYIYSVFNSRYAWQYITGFMVNNICYGFEAVKIASV